MKHLFLTTTCVFASAALALAAGIPQSGVRGDYIEARTADVYTGPCFANGEVNQVGNLAVFGWNIQHGVWQGVQLDGLSVVGVVRAAGTLGTLEPVGPVKAVLIVDQRANAEQRQALRSLAQRMGGDLLRDIVRVDYLPIHFSLRDNNLHTATATLAAGNVARIETRALNGGDKICHNEETFYPPLVHLDHAMPAYTLASGFQGAGLGTVWSSPGKRSAFVGSFHIEG
jgi:hypothetical protein